MIQFLRKYLPFLFPEPHPDSLDALLAGTTPVTEKIGLEDDGELVDPVEKAHTASRLRLKLLGEKLFAENTTMGEYAKTLLSAYETEGFMGESRSSWEYNNASVTVVNWESVIPDLIKKDIPENPAEAYDTLLHESVRILLNVTHHILGYHTNRYSTLTGGFGTFHVPANIQETDWLAIPGHTYHGIDFAIIRTLSEGAAKYALRERGIDLAQISPNTPD